jgi:hypothetical protein
MSTRSTVARHGYSQGQILLERALFCVGCEIIFTGCARCPRCTSGESVWPLSEWFRSARSTTVSASPSQPGMELDRLTRQRQKQSAA